MIISKSTLNEQCRHIDELKQKCNEVEIDKIKKYLNDITDFKLEYDECLQSMNTINKIATEKSMKPIFITKENAILEQSDNIAMCKTSDQRKTINTLIQKCDTDNIGEIEYGLRCIKNFAWMHDKCLQSMDNINEIAIKKSLGPIFIMKEDIILKQSINIVLYQFDNL